MRDMEIRVHMANLSRSKNLLRNRLRGKVVLIIEKLYYPIVLQLIIERRISVRGVGDGR